MKTKQYGDVLREKRRGRDSGSAIPEELLDEIDWRESERECRQTCFVGLPLTPNP